MLNGAYPFVSTFSMFCHILSPGLLMDEILVRSKATAPYGLGYEFMNPYNSF